MKGLNRCLGGGPNQNGVEIVVPAPFGYNTSNMLNLPSSQYCMRMYKRTEILSLFLVHLKVPFCVGRRGTKRVLEYARLAIWDSLMFGRLAMGFAHVRAGTRVLTRGSDRSRAAWALGSRIFGTQIPFLEPKFQNPNWA